MLDLAQLATSHLSASFTDAEWFREKDPSAVNAVADTTRNQGERVSAVRDWLQDYSVLQGFTAEQRLQIAMEIILFADARLSIREIKRNDDWVVGEFRTIEAQINNLGFKNADGSLRRVESLTSKALWLCYPHDAPMLDDNAERALQFISRSCGFRVPEGLSRYERFTEAWFHFYSIVRSTLEQNRPKNYPYTVRLFDWLLWYLGKPSFETR